MQPSYSKKISVIFLNFLMLFQQSSKTDMIPKIHILNFKQGYGVRKIICDSDFSYLKFYNSNSNFRLRFYRVGKKYSATNFTLKHTTLVSSIRVRKPTSKVIKNCIAAELFAIFNKSRKKRPLTILKLP